MAGHSMMCDVSLPINRDHRVLSVKGLVFFLLRGSRIKHEITTLGLLSVLCQPGVPVLPGEAGGSCSAVTLLLPVVGGGAAGIACQKVLPMRAQRSWGRSLKVC